MGDCADDHWRVCWDRTRVRGRQYLCWLHCGLTESCVLGVVVGADGWVVQYRVGGEHLLQAGVVRAVMNRIVMAVDVGSAGSGIGVVPAYQGAVGAGDLRGAGVRVDAECGVQVGLVVAGHGHRWWGRAVARPEG